MVRWRTGSLEEGGRRKEKKDLQKEERPGRARRAGKLY
jgi:hypothetical protein